jgi:hypothetical protein
MLSILLILVFELKCAELLVFLLTTRKSHLEFLELGVEVDATDTTEEIHLILEVRVGLNLASYSLSLAVSLT